MKILKISCKTKGKKGKKGIKYTWMPKDKTHSGHMDSQMYPECEGSKYDRNISKKHKKKKHSFNLSKSIRISCAKPNN